MRRWEVRVYNTYDLLFAKTDQYLNLVDKVELFLWQIISHLEGKVEGLLGEISDDAGKVSPPEAGKSLPGVGPHHALSHPTVGSVQPSLFEEFPLIL